MRAACLPWLVLLGCAQEDIAAILPSEGGGADAGTVIDGGTTGEEDFCAGSGPVLLVGDSSGSDVCGSAVAERTFRFALCSCEGYTSSHALQSDSFDSRLGPYVPGGRGGSVGVNGRIAAAGPLTVGGSLWAGHADGIQAGAAGTLEVAGELRSAGPIASEAPVRVDHDAWVGGRVQAPDLFVGGTLHLPSGAAVDVAGSTAIGTTTREPVSVSAPCDCGALVDIAGYVARHESDNDDPSVGLDPKDLENLSGPTRLELGCGRFYVDRIGGDGALTLAVTGRAALFVGGDVALQNQLIVEVAPGGELDLFVAGIIVSSERLILGSPDRPARVRLYVGGTGTLQLSGGALVAGNLYAPRAELTTSAAVEVFGSLFVRRVAASAELTIHYDTAVLSAADDCPTPPPAACDSCLDCRNNACNPDGCGACTDSTDCCAPLVCVGGTCVPEL